MIDSNFHGESCISAMGRSTTAQIRADTRNLDGASVVRRDFRPTL